MSAHATTMLAAHPAATLQPAEWSELYRSGELAALLAVVFLPIQIAVFIINPPPDSVAGWFSLFASSRLVGLLDLDILLVADQVLTILMYLSLYVALRRISPSGVLIGVALGLLSAVLFMASNPAYSMLTLSNAYGAATTEAQRSVLLAAGQAAMSLWQGSAFQASYLLGSIAAILVSAVMLRSSQFSKAAAYMGILSNTLALGLYVPRIGTYISVLSVVFLWAWYLLVGVKLLQLPRVSAKEQA